MSGRWGVMDQIDGSVSITETTHLPQPDPTSSRVGSDDTGQEPPTPPHQAAVGIHLNNVIPTLDTRQVYRRRTYASSQVDLLVMKYAQIRSDFYVSLPYSPKPRTEYAERIWDYLTDAKKELERHSPNLPVTASLLAAADSLLVWLYSDAILVQRTTTTLALLDSAKKGAEERSLKGCLDYFHKSPLDGETRLRIALETSLRALHELDRDGLLGEDLQVRRLRILMIYLGLAFALLLAAIPFTTDMITTPQITDGQVRGVNIVWPVFLPTDRYGEPAGSTIVYLVLAALGLAAIGAAGGVISGMLKIRDSRATLLSYRASLLNLALKPIVGAVAALVLYIFLSWSIIKGLDISSPGVFLISAFLAGFSERYFLRTIRAASNEVAASDSTGESANDQTASPEKVRVASPKR
jgi:hypothetical protein